MLRSINHPDTDIVEDLDKGFRLTGWLPPSNLFPKMSSPPQISTLTLEFLGPCLNAAAVNRCERNSSFESAKAVLDITIDEVKRGWTVEEVDMADLKEGTILSPRFIIHQGEKSRAIDDFTFSSINSTVGTSEKIVLQGVDEIASLIKHLFATGFDDLEGRTFDMEAAYRQLAVLPSDRPKRRSSVCLTLTSTGFGVSRWLRCLSEQFPRYTHSFEQQQLSTTLGVLCWECPCHRISMTLL